MVIPVSLGAQSYEITLVPGALSHAADYLSLNRRVLVVTDSGVPQAYAAAIAAACPTPCPPARPARILTLSTCSCGRCSAWRWTAPTAW